MYHNFYSLEQNVQHEMREVERHVQHARLLREIDESNTGLLARLRGAVQNLLRLSKAKRQEPRLVESRIKVRGGDKPFTPDRTLEVWRK